MSFITDYQKLNQENVRNPYPLPKIVETIQQLGGVQYSIVLDLNIGYYTIDIFPKSRNHTNIVTESGEFSFNIVPMGLCSSSDIFQAK